MDSETLYTLSKITQPPTAIAAKVTVQTAYTHTSGNNIQFSMPTGTTAATSNSNGFTNGPTYSTTTNQLTTQTAGLYVIAAGVYFTYTGSLTSAQFFLQQSIGGVIYNGPLSWITNSAGNTNAQFAQNVSGLAWLNPGDYIYTKFSFTATSVTVQNVSESCMSMALVGTYS